MPAKTTAQLKKKGCKTRSVARSAFRRGESGNIFFTLFGAVAIVGLLGAVVVATIRGPLSTMVEVQNRAKAEAEMSIASRMVLLEAAQQTADGDCDGDGFVEPLEYADSAGTGPGGGGFLPLAVASSRTDPWGTDYGYCSWDAGSATTTIGCDNDSSGTNQRLEGNGNPTDETYTVVALISAGPDQKFDSSCSGGPTPSVVRGGDDIVTEFNYAEARASADGLWNLKTGDPGTAEIDKNLEVSGQGAFSGGIDLTGSSAALELGAASMLFPSESTLSTCNAANDGLIRINTSSDPNSLQLCDDPTGWVSVGAELWETGTGDDIYYNEGTPQVGIGTTSPNEALHVVGNILASGNFSGANITGSGNAAIAGTLGVTGTSTLSALNATGAVDFDTTLNTDGAVTFGSTLGVTGATTLSTLNATGAVDFDSTLNTDGAVTFGSTLGVTGTSNLAAVNASGAVDFNSTLNVDGATTLTSTLDAQGTISNTTGDVTVGDNLNVSGNIDGSDITASGDLIANSTVIVAGDQLGPPLTCTSTQKLEWNVGAGWSCVIDLQGGSGGGIPSLDDLTDVVIAAPVDNDCVAYDAIDGRWENTPCSATGIFENVASVVRIRAAAGDYATDDFVFGSPQLADDTDTDHYNRFYFDKSKGAFRSGSVTGTYWDDANVGNYSFAAGRNNVALGASSSVLGEASWAGGYGSTAIGLGAVANGDTSLAIGREIVVSGTGDGSIGIGLTTTSPAVDPIVSGAQSFGIFMGDQSGYDLTTANRMALVGGDFLLDDAGATGSQGCFRYNGAGGTLQFSNDCTTFFDLSGTNSNVFEVTGGVGTELVRTVNANAPYSTSDFLFGASQLADTGNVSEQNRVFFDKSKASFRAGAVTSTQWDDANVGVASTAIGSNVTASGVGSTAIGSETVAGGLLSTSTGFQTSAGGDYSFTLGNQVATTGAGDASVAFGLTTTSPATDPVVSGTQSFGIFMGDQSGYNLATNNRMGLIGGDFMIDDAGATGAQGCIRYNGVTTKLEISNDCTTFINADGTDSDIFEVTGAPGSEIVRNRNTVAPHATADFLFGSAQLADAGNASEDNRMFFDKSRAAFRVGGVSGTEWDDVNVGTLSFASGLGTIASGYISTAMGNFSIASGQASFAVGTQNITAGDNSVALGREINVSATGDGSMGIGLTTTSPATDPIISGAQSFGIFMGNHSAVNFAAANTVGLFGGRMVIDPNVPATQLTARSVLDLGAATDSVVMPLGTTAQRPGAPVNGMIRYNSDNGKFEAYQQGVWQDILTSATGNQTSLSSITAATTTNTIANGIYMQGWDWALTGATDDAFTFGETVASINGVGAQSILKATTVPASTAVPLLVTNLGNSHSFRVNDETNDGDATPFVIDASGNVGIGTTTLAVGAKLDVEGPVKLGIYNDAYLGVQNNLNPGGEDYLFSVPDGETRIVGFGNVTGGWDAAKIEITKTAGNNDDGTMHLYTTGHGGTQLFLDELGSVGIGTNLPATNLEVAGALRLSTTTTDTFTTPGAGSVPTKINIPIYDPGAFGQILAFGLPSTAAVSSRAISVFDARNTGAVQPAISLFSVNEADVLGLSWEGGSSTGYLKTLGGNIGLRIGSNTYMTIQPPGANNASVVFNGSDAVTLPSGTTAQRPGTPTGGMFRYNTDATPADTIEYYDAEGATWRTMAASGAGNVALSSITAATAANTIASGVHMQNWNWALTGATDDAFSFGETTAATNGTGTQSILKASTLATSTAVPLLVTNLGNGYSFRVNDNAGDADATPFVIDAAGNVGIGTDTPAAALHVEDYNRIRIGYSNGGNEYGVDVTAYETGSGHSYGIITNTTSNPSSAVTGIGVFVNNAAGRGALLSSSSITTGTMMDFAHGASAFSGNMIQANLANASGSFTGNFIRFQNNSDQRFYVADDGEVGAYRYCDEDGNNCFLPSSIAGTGIWQNNGGVVRTVDAAAPHATADFLFGSAQLADAGNAAEDSRMFFDKSKGAFRAGSVTGTQWDDVNVGAYSFASGYNSIALGDYSVAMGDSNDSSGFYAVALGANNAADASASVAIGSTNTANGTLAVAIGGLNTSSGSRSTVIGHESTAGGDYSIALGREINVSATGDGSMGIGLTTTSPATDPIVSGAQSFVVFMGNHSGVNYSAANTAAFLGGDFLVNGTWTDTASVPQSGAGTRMFFDVQTSAFRAGTVSGTQWDTPGSFSFAAGNNTTASNYYSTAFGNGTTASGNTSTAFGDGTTASGITSFAAGLGSVASGARSTALGGGNTASNDNAFATGQGTLASAANSTAMGRFTIAAGDDSTALGREVNVSATGDGSMGIGLTTTAQATDPIVSGAESLGIFLGDHSGVDFTPARTMGVFGGSLVIDPNEPATQLTARGVIDVGAATDSIVLPRGTTAQRPGILEGGMFRYNTTSTPADTLEYYDAEGATWRSLTAAGAGSVEYIDDLLDAETDYATDFNMFMGSGAGASIAMGGQYNLAIGQNAGTAITTGDSNIAFGYNSLAASTIGSDKIAIGENALSSHDASFSMVAIGTDALSNVTASAFATAVGTRALSRFTSSDHNTAVGYEALFGGATGTITGGNNTCLGSQCLRAMQNGSANVAVGKSAGGNTTIGSSNVAMGHNALEENVAGSESTAIGYRSMYYANSSSTGFITYNTALGYQALRGSATPASNTGTQNTALGHSVLLSNTTGSYNTGVGVNALNANTTGNDNSALGRDALEFNTTGIGNTAMGYATLNTNTTKQQSTAFGFEAMRYADSSAGGGITYNTAVGYQALYGSTTAANNTGIGNTAVGHSSMLNITSGSANTAMGYLSLQSLTTGVSNTAVGEDALSAVQTGNNNTAIGTSALMLTTGDGNAAFGTNAGSALTSGGSNTLLGAEAGSNLTTGGSNIIIGNTIDASSATVSNELNIGNTIFGDLANDRIRIGGTGAVSAFSDLELAGTLALKLSSGTDAQRPGTPAGGMFRYNTTSTPADTLEYYDAEGATWRTLLASGAGSIQYIDDLLDAETDYATDFNMFMGSGAGTSIAVGGQYNLGIGQNAGNAITTGDNNIAVGFDALALQTTGTDNIAIGRNALDAATTQSAVIAIGTNAMGAYNSGFADGSVAIGYNAFGSKTGAYGGVAIGYGAAQSSVTADNILAIGTNALANATNHSNHCVGNYCLANTTGGTENSAFGLSVMSSNTTGSYNSAFGQGAMSANIDGSYNSAFGQNTLSANVAGNQSTAMGYEAMRYANSSGTTFTTYNTALGYQALRGSTTAADNTGTYNTALGHTSLIGNTSGAYNIGLGPSTLYDNTTGSANIAIGVNTLRTNVASNNNTAIGHEAMRYANSTSSSTSTNNTALGYQALRGSATAASNTGVNNTAIGHSSMLANTSGASNTAVGRSAMAANTTGGLNTALGFSAMPVSTTGGSNVSVGAYTMNSNTTGGYNTAVGYQSMEYNTTGTGNVGLGYYTGAAGGGNTVGDYNTWVGYNASSNANNYTNSTALGYGATITASNQMVFGNSSVTNAIFSGTGAVTLPNGTTAQRPGTAAGGMFRYNTDATPSDTIEYYDAEGATWQTLLTSGGAGMVDEIDDLSDALTMYGSGNMFLGHEAPDLTTGTNNTTLGAFAGDSITTGQGHVAIGHNALTSLQTGGNSIAIGPEALSNDIGGGNIGIGSQAGRQITTGGNNIAIGIGSLRSLTGAYANIAIGYDALWQSTGGSNVAIGGYHAMYGNTTGADNVAVGYRALSGNSAGNQSVAIGHEAMLNANDSSSAFTTYNTALGYQALMGSATPADNTGIENTAVGHSTLAANTSGQFNTAMGSRAMSGNLDGEGNTAMGRFSLRDNTGGDFNTAIGDATMTSNISGANNTAVGRLSLNANTTGAGNTGIGANSLIYSTGGGNTAVGQNALSTLSSGDYNSAFGDGALMGATTGSENNTAMGFIAGGNITTGDRNIMIGASTNAPSATGDDQLNIGNTIYGDLANNLVGIGIPVPTRNLHVYGASGYVTAMIENDGTTSSDGASLEMNRGGSGAYANIDFTTGASTDFGFGLYAGNSNFSIWDNSGGDVSRFMIDGSTGNIGFGNFVADTIDSAVHIQTGDLRLDGGAGNQAGCIRYNDTTDRIEFSHDCTTFADMGGSAPGAIALNDLSDAVTDYATDFNMIIGGNPTSTTGLAVGAQYNLFIGQGAGATTANSTSDTDRNVAVGYDAMTALTTGIDNTAVGYSAMPSMTTGFGNVAVGRDALLGKIASVSNIGIGFRTLAGPGSGSNNIAIGEEAVNANTTGSYNVGIGSDALKDNSTGGANIAVGYGALANSTTDDQVAIGDGALTTAVTAIENTAVGRAALTLNTGDANTAVGFNAMTDTTTGQRNTAVGRGAMSVNSTGSYNTAIGDYAMNGVTTGEGNVAVGHLTLDGGANGNYMGNVAVGANVLRSNEGNYNTAVGGGSLHDNTLGENNVALGNTALAANTDGNDSVAIGYYALSAQTTGGTQNIAVGYQAGNNITTGDLNIIVGHDIDAMSATGNSQLNIGDTIFGDLANDRIRIGGTGAVGAGPFIANPPAAEAIAAAGTITANACGTIKQISSTGAVTTGTTNTFTAPTAAYAGCCMDVVNVDTADTITLDDNANFLTGGGANIALAPNDSIRVCSNGTYWYHVEDKVAGGAATAAGADREIQFNNGGVLGAEDNFTYTYPGIDPALTLWDGTDTTYMSLLSNLSTAYIDVFRPGDDYKNLEFRVHDLIFSGNRMGLNVAVPSYLLSLDGDTANQTIGMERELTAATPGRNLTIQAGGAVSGGTGLMGGDLILSGGITTGDGSTGSEDIGSRVRIFTSSSGLGGGTTDRTPEERAQFTQWGLAFNTVDWIPEGQGIVFNANRLWQGSQLYWNSDSAFSLQHDAGNDAFSFSAAPPGTAGATITYTEAMNINSAGSVNITNAMRLQSDITSASLGASQNNYNPTGLSTASVIRLTASTPINITGLQGGADGRIITLMNIGANAITLADDSGSSTAANRFALTSDLILAQDQATALIYDSTSSRWRVYGGDGTGSAGAIAIDDLTDAETDYVTDFNIFMGSNAGAGVAVGAEGNLAIGINSLAAALTSAADWNTAVGFQTLQINTSGQWNSVLGYNALSNNTTGSTNAVLGVEAAQFMESGNANVAIGPRALRGANAWSGNYSGNTGTHNVALGEDALAGISSGTDNIGIGFGAGSAVSTGTGNIAIGQSASGGTTANNNIAIGLSSGFSNETGINNISIGILSLAGNVSANGNTAIGAFAMRYANDDPGFASWQPSYNTAIGAEALMGSGTPADNTGVSNTAIGYSAMTAVTSGSNNVALGDRAADNLTTGSNNITIGSDIDAVSATGSNQMNVGNTIFGDLSNDYVRIGGTGAVTTGPLIAAPPAAETIAAAGTITANACGTIKQISSTGAVTTGTTNTFTAPTAAYAGCCMDVVNVDTADTITLDDNANFLTGGGANIALAPNDSIRVCSNGTYWYHVEDKIAGGAASTALSSITDATATNTIDNDNYAQVWNWNTLTTQDAMTIASTAQTTGSLLRLHSANASGLGSALYIESDQTGGSGNVSALDVSSNAAGSGTNAINAFVNSSGAVAISASNGNGTSISARTTTDTQPTIFSWNNSVTGPAVGLEGASETTGTGAGVYGNINGTNNTGYGVWGQNASRSGYGVFSEGALRVAPAAMTLANGAAIDYNTAIFTAPTLTVGSTNVTSMMDSYLFQAPTLTRGSAVTVTNASTMTIAGAPVRAGSLALTNTHGLYIGAGAVSTATNSYGIYANAQTGATNNYAAALMGGYVGIGINAPTNTLHVEGDMSYTPLVKIRNTSTTGVSGLELFDDANAFKGVFGHFNFDYDGVTDPLGIVANDNDIVFVTGDTGSAPGTVRMMVDASSGFVGIGNITPTVALDVTGDIRHTGIIIDASDIRLKTDIRHLPEVKGDILARLQQIKGYQFRMKGDTTGQIEYGVIAQEIERVFPELVVTDKTAEGMKSVNYVGLIAPLIEATKELKSENDSLKAKIADFDARMAALENNVDELKLFTGFGVSKASMGLLGIFALLIMSGIVVVIRRKTLAQ